MEDQRHFLELRSLSRLLPSFRGDHPGNTNSGVSGVDTSDELQDPLWFCSGCGDDGRLLDQPRHLVVYDVTTAVPLTLTISMLPLCPTTS